MTYALRPAIGNRTAQFVSPHFQDAATLEEAHTIANRIVNIPCVEVYGWRNDISLLQYPRVSIVHVPSWRIVAEVGRTEV